MKNKILPFIIGLLVGAIIATTGFLIYSKSVSSNSNQPIMMQMNGNGQKGDPPGNMEQPPEKTDDSNNNTNN